MKMIHASYEILELDDPSNIYKRIERAGRTCYKSEDHITDESARKFVRNLVKNGHEAMLEHASMTVKFIVDRGVSHELVRHRVASFAQESTRYCNYEKDKFGKEITVIVPCFFSDIPAARKAGIADYLDGVIKYDNFQPGDFTPAEQAFGEWYLTCERAEIAYFAMLDYGFTPQEARTVLPNSLKTEVIMTANMREWRHFFKLRAAGETGAPHPQMVEVALPLLKDCQKVMPELFGDILPANEQTKVEPKQSWSQLPDLFIQFQKRCEAFFNAGKDKKEDDNAHKYMIKTHDISEEEKYVHD